MSGQPTAINPITKPGLIQLSLPTKKQVITGAEIIIVAFVGATVGTWVAQPNPFSKHAAIVALTTGVAAVWAIVRGFATNL